MAFVMISFDIDAESSHIEQTLMINYEGVDMAQLSMRLIHPVFEHCKWNASVLFFDG